MKKNHDVLFKVGIGLQALLIPIAFIWRFSPEANYYNWAITICTLLVLVLCFWPQATIVRLERLKAIKIQFIVVISLLFVSWGGYTYFYNFTRANCTPAYVLPAKERTIDSPVFKYGQNCNFDISRTDIATSTVMYRVNWHPVFGRDWLMLLGPGINIPTAILLTALFTALPAANLYKYKLDKKRFKGLKKDELFI
jgi:hypothetical protein